MNDELNDDLHHLAAAYALDALDAGERARFEAHLATCETCRADVDDFVETAGRMAGASAVAPPPGLRDRVLDEIARTPQVSPLPAADASAEEEAGAPPADVPADEAQGASPVDELSLRRHHRAPQARWLAAAAAVAIAIAGALLVVGARGSGVGVDDVLAAPDAVVTSLERTPDGTAGTFQVVWSRERDLVAVIASGLPDPGDGSVYELWAIADGEPVPAGVFEPGDSLREVARIGDVEPEAWGVTIEPDGGSDAPTTPILFYAEA